MKNVMFAVLMMSAMIAVFGTGCTKKYQPPDKNRSAGDPIPHLPPASDLPSQFTGNVEKVGEYLPFPPYNGEGLKENDLLVRGTSIWQVNGDRLTMSLTSDRTKKDTIPGYEAHPDSFYYATHPLDTRTAFRAVGASSIPLRTVNSIRDIINRDSLVACDVIGANAGSGAATFEKQRISWSLGSDSIIVGKNTWVAHGQDSLIEPSIYPVKWVFTFSGKKAVLASGGGGFFYYKIWLIPN